MNNLSDFPNFGEFQIFWGSGGAKVCAPGAKNPRYTPLMQSIADDNTPNSTYKNGSFFSLNFFTQVMGHKTEIYENNQENFIFD